MDWQSFRGAKKKLSEAAVYWAGGGKGKFDDDDAKMLGEMVEDEPFLVWQENQEAVEVFTACATQWRWAEGQRVALIYSEVETVMKLLKINDKTECFHGIRIMESAALEVWK